eukprot:gene15782-biopygen5219
MVGGGTMVGTPTMVESPTMVGHGGGPHHGGSPPPWCGPPSWWGLHARWWGEDKCHHFTMKHAQTRNQHASTAVVSLSQYIALTTHARSHARACTYERTHAHARARARARASHEGPCGARHAFVGVRVRTGRGALYKLRGGGRAGVEVGTWMLLQTTTVFDDWYGCFDWKRRFLTDNCCCVSQIHIYLAPHPHSL